MKWGGGAAVGEVFETQLAAAIIGEPMRADAELGPRTQAALVRLATADSETRWDTAALARKAFEGEGRDDQDGRARQWVRARCFEVATSVAASAMSWCSKRLYDTGEDTYRDQRAAFLAGLTVLDPDQPDQVAEWVVETSEHIARWRGEEEDEAPGNVARLAPEVLAELFDTEVAPDLLHWLRRSDDPTAVLVAGRPGVGVAAGVRWQAAMLPGCVAVTGGVVGGFHPFGWDCGDLGGAGAIAEDVAVWLGRLARHVVRARTNAVVGVGDSAVAAGRCSRIFEDAGYRVRRMTVTVNEPVRRLSQLVCSAALEGRWGRVCAAAGGGG